MANLLQPANGAERIADALLHNNGGASVLLRIPSSATPDDDAEQLGLAVPQFQDVPLAPAVWRRSANDTQLLLAATAVRSVVGTLNATSAEALFSTAIGIVAGDVVYEILAWHASEAKGEPFCYQLTLRKPQP